MRPTVLLVYVLTEGLEATGVSLAHRQDIFVINAVDFSKSDGAVVAFPGNFRRRRRGSFGHCWVSR